ncbi:MAG TPA: hypothetical protein VGY77_10210 [Gemmataceae bacterium]|jgi:hypothetical protein|nr:hypothetical protein [Gemmataceae bacterium]
MSSRELILLSPYQFPGQNSSVIGSDEVADFLNAYAALWHPAALTGASGPPRISSPYHYEQPGAGHIYAIPENPPLYQPDDWERRVAEAGAIAFRSAADRQTGLANLFAALNTLQSTETETEPARRKLQELPPEKVRPFFGLGFGYAMLNALFAAMEHENLIAVADFWQDVQNAVTALEDPDPEAFRRSLQAAAERLYSARQVLYSVDIHLLDLFTPDFHNLIEPWPAAFDRGTPLNVIASASLLEKLARECPERCAALRERVAAEMVEVCGGPYQEREDPLLPIESQMWNLVGGLKVARELLSNDIRVFARKRFGFHPHLPLLLTNVGLFRALLMVFDEGGLPAFHSAVVTWPSPDGKQVDAFTKTPYPANDAGTFFHTAHYLHKTIMQDQNATLALWHSKTPAGPWYEDWLELSRLAPVLGQWKTVTRYFNDVLAGEYSSPASPDEFHNDYLSERTDSKIPHPVSRFPQHQRQRRRLDTLWTLAAIHRGVAGANDNLMVNERTADLETKVECWESATPANPFIQEAQAEFSAEALETELNEVQKEITEALAERLLGRARSDNEGILVLNSCSFARRLALELPGAKEPLPLTGPLKACQVDGANLRLVVEVPSLGFAWVPCSGPPGTEPMPMRMKLADPRHVRNEFFEAEIDPATGGLRGFWDHRTRANRIGQQLVFNPGSTMRATEIKVNSIGPALGEVVSEGALYSDQDQVLATYRQRFRAWLGRPILEIRIEIYPEHPPEGYPWHSYYGARFAWRDEHAVLLRSVTGTGYVTTHTRPQTPDYLELRRGKQNTVIFPGGLPFHQRHGSRMVDVLLVSPGETAHSFDLALGMDRENPMQTALGLVTPVTYVHTKKGPPHVGDKGWLFHLDSPNLLLTSLRPAPDGADAIIARLLEISQYGGSAELRCVRNPCRAVIVDGRGEALRETEIHGDAAVFEVCAGDLVQVRVEFS